MNLTAEFQTVQVLVTAAKTGSLTGASCQFEELKATLNEKE